MYARRHLTWCVSLSRPILHPTILCRQCQMGVMSGEPTKANHCADLQAGCISLKWVGVEAITLAGPTPVTICT